MKKCGCCRLRENFCWLFGPAPGAIYAHFGPKHFLFLEMLASTITAYISISAFASLLDIPIGITSSAIGIKISAIAAGIKKYKSIIKKKKKKHDKILLLEIKIKYIEVLISKALIDWNISHDVFVLINNLLKEYDDMKEEIENLKT